MNILKSINRKNQILFKLKKFNTEIKLFLPNINFYIISDSEISVHYEKENVDFEKLINYLKENGLKILDISIHEGDLEDVFLKLTKNQIINKNKGKFKYGTRKKF